MFKASSTWTSRPRRAAPLLIALALTASACPEDMGDTDATASAGSTSDGGSTGDTSATSSPTTSASGGSTGMAVELSHAADIQPIWDKYCMTNCHMAGGSGAGSLLMDGSDYEAIVNVPSLGVPSMNLVTPGDQMNSYLWHKLDGTMMEVGGSGSKMPLGMAMTQDELDTVGTWIDQGAKP